MTITAIPMLFEKAYPLKMIDRSPSAFSICALLIILFYGLLIMDDGLLYARHTPSRDLLHSFIWISFLFSAAGIVMSWQRKSRWLIPTIPLGLAWASMIAAYVCVLFASPRPFIDTFYSEIEAVNHFLSGRNPYTANYTDIYKGYFTDLPMFGYPPAVLYWITPFVLLFRDPRFSFIACNIVISYCLFSLAQKIFHSSVFGLITALLWLTFPTSLFVLEQSWIEPFPIMIILLFTLAQQNGRWVLSGFFLAALLAAKQPMVLFISLAILYCWRKYGPRAAIKILATCIVTFFLMIAPFVLNDFNSFFDRMVTQRLTQPFRADSFSLTAFFHHIFGLMLPLYIRIISMGVILFLSLRYLLHQSRARGLSSLFGASWILYGSFFLLAHQAFCNYHFFVVAIVLVYAITSLHQGVVSSNLTAPTNFTVWV